jgi:hypothetical protein
MLRVPTARSLARQPPQPRRRHLPLLLTAAADVARNSEYSNSLYGTGGFAQARSGVALLSVDFSFLEPGPRNAIAFLYHVM